MGQGHGCFGRLLRRAELRKDPRWTRVVVRRRCHAAARHVDGARDPRRAAGGVRSTAGYELRDAGNPPSRLGSRAWYYERVRQRQPITLGLRLRPHARPSPNRPDEQVGPGNRTSHLEERGTWERHDGPVRRPGTLYAIGMSGDLQQAEE